MLLLKIIWLWMILVFLIFIIPKYHIHNPPYFRKRTLKFLLNSIWTCSVEGDTILHDGGLQTKKLDQSPINVTASYYFVADYIHDYVLGCLLLLKSVSNELLCLKNAGAQISLLFTSHEQSAPMAIEKIKILGTVLELPAKQQCQSSPQKWAKWAELAVLFNQ